MPEPFVQPSPLVAALLCRCPRCGRAPLFTGYLKVRAACPVCGLDLGFAESGDGPAIFIIFIVGFLIMALAALVETMFHPAPYIHLVLWIHATIVLSMLLLRPFKAFMVAMLYRNDAREGRL